MSELILFCLSLICLTIGLFFIVKFIDYEVYVSNNLSEANDKRYEYDFASIKEYEMIVSRLDIQLYTRYIDGNDIIDESHLIFNGRMMILYPVSYFKFIRRVKNKNRKRKRIKGLWKSYLK